MSSIMTKMLQEHHFLWNGSLKNSIVFPSLLLTTVSEGFLLFGFKSAGQPLLDFACHTEDQFNYRSLYNQNSHHTRQAEATKCPTVDAVSEEERLQFLEIYLSTIFKVGLIFCRLQTLLMDL